MSENQPTHSILMGYLLWIFGFMGAHRFYYGKQITGVIWFCTLGLFFIGWIIDLFLIPSMQREAERRPTADRRVTLRRGLVDAHDQRRQVCGRLGITIKDTPGDEHAGGSLASGGRRPAARRRAPSLGSQVTVWRRAT